MYDENDIIFNQYSLDFFALINSLYVRISALFGSAGNIDPSLLSDPFAIFPVTKIVGWLTAIWSGMVVLSWLVSFVILFGLIYAYLRHAQLGEVVSEILKKQEESFSKINKKDVKNLRWLDAQNHVAGPNPSEWKLAIIEADILLGELLDKLGYAGTTIGEKLKSVSADHFRTINNAWRAHNVRNRIAHEGADFQLSKKEAQETITQYKMVFEEFDFI